MFIKSVCMNCNQNPATIKIVKIINGKVTDINLCEKCARKVSPLQKKMFEEQEKLKEVIQNLLSGSSEKQSSSGEETAKEEADAVCTVCGLKFESYRKSAFLGCPRCYDSFEKYLVSYLRRMHGSTLHCGKVPPRHRTRLEYLRTISQLQKELDKAIEGENYEKAAQIRDQLRALKAQLEIQ
ncbi:MAG: UvrB/UvrC motif-containing protein [Candidatus Sumerlaeia bacterium]|nr:UvrB/UvrC motif-containing protein [Candidatus Sumerlaeia bacterium]